ncbi:MULTISPECIES: hypothetical protein [Bacillus cereus group]|uniref:hypothetical protein n=1 Tax=Bacillus cereus group TaxID=86661 RepID=UPI0020D285BB|nr:MULTISPECIES: hypothetical protein [Bacillus cereus group]
MEQGQYKHVNALVVERCLKWTKRTVPNNDQGLPYYAEFWVDEKGEKMKRWSLQTSGILPLMKAMV